MNWKLILKVLRELIRAIGNLFLMLWSTILFIIFLVQANQGVLRLDILAWSFGLSAFSSIELIRMNIKEKEIDKEIEAEHLLE